MRTVRTRCYVINIRNLEFLQNDFTFRMNKTIFIVKIIFKITFKIIKKHEWTSQD